MRIRIFRGSTLAAAMAQVRDELGLDALILETASRDGMVEVTAALEPEDEPEPLDLPGFDPLQGLHPLPAPELRPTTPVSDALLRHNLPATLLSALQQGPLEAGCSRLFRFTRLPVDADGPPLLLAGPPGAGKTLTIAKLATRLVMEGHRPLVITADEQRAGAVEQLAAFTRLLGLTLIAAGRPEMLARALERRETLSPVLIDAPGLDLLDPAQSDLLVSLTTASKARVGLVLPAGLDPMEAGEIAAAHAGHGVELLIATRIDRAGRLGGILAAAHGAGLALTEAGTGTGVADGLTQLTPKIIAFRLVGSPLAGSLADQAEAPMAPAIPALPITRSGGASSTMALHIAAQTGSRRLPLWKTNP